LKDGRLEIAATVDAEGLKTLKDMLERYEGILDLLKPKRQRKRPPTEAALQGIK
jgi:hypothetical protein